MTIRKAEAVEETTGEDELQKRLRAEEESERLRAVRMTGSTRHGGQVQPRRLNAFQGITEVRPYLLLCGALALRGGDVLRDLDVTCVVNATRELPDTPIPDSKLADVLYLRVGVADKADSDILTWLDTVADLIHQVRLASGKTLVHCVAGVSRSATLCLAYLIKHEGYTLYDSYMMLRQVRPIRPNAGFFAQLIEFEKRVTGKQTVVMIQSDYTSTWIPHLYEDDYHKLHVYKCMRLKT